MKRILLILLLAAILVGSYWGYTGARPETAGPGTAPTGNAPDAASALPDPTLLTVLDEMRDSVHPGTAGSSLRAAIAAADLLDWAGTGPEQAALAASVREWLSEQSEEVRSLLPEQIESLRWAFGMLTEEYEASTALMEDAGLTGRGPWSDTARDTAAQVLDLLESI